MVDRDESLTPIVDLIHETKGRVCEANEGIEDHAHHVPVAIRFIIDRTHHSVLTDQSSRVTSIVHCLHTSKHPGSLPCPMVEMGAGLSY